MNLNTKPKYKSSRGKHGRTGDVRHTPRENKKIDWVASNLKLWFCKGHSEEGEKIVHKLGETWENHVSEKSLVSRTYRELSKLSNKENKQAY